jgi:hypothetical protein
MTESQPTACRSVAKRKLLLRCRLAKLPSPFADLVPLVSTLIYDLVLDQSGCCHPTPSQRIESVALDLNELCIELDEIEKMPKISKSLAANVAEQRRALVSSLFALERLATPGLRRSAKGT